MRQITVLDQAGVSTGTRVVTVVFWFQITNASAKVPKPGFVSRATNVTTAEQTALESGDILEEVFGFEFPSSYTTAEMKSLINKRYTDRANAIAALPAARAFYGVTFDSVTGWSA